MVQATQTDQTCGAACWYAQERVCRCSCGGRAHGCMVDAADNAYTPRRNCRIKGARYVMGTVGSRWALDRLGRTWRGRMYQDTCVMQPNGLLSAGDTSLIVQNDVNAVTWLRVATPAEVAAWPELAQFVGERRRPNILWVRMDMADAWDAYLATAEVPR